MLLHSLRHTQTGELFGDTSANRKTGISNDMEAALAAEAQRVRWISFTRSDTAIENEIALVQHLASRFIARRPSSKETETKEFTSGFGEGLDLREMLRDETRFADIHPGCHHGTGCSVRP